MRSDAPRHPPQRPPRLARAGAAALVAFVLAGLAGRRLLAWPDQVPPDRLRVGACGFGPTCRDVNCHITFPEEVLVPDLHLEAPDAPLPAAYRPGETYRLRLDVEDFGFSTSLLGFALAPLASCPTPVDGGTLRVLEPLRTQVQQDLEFGLHYLAHAWTCQPITSDPTCWGVLPAVPGVNGWSFEWIAPARGSGDVVFHVAVNAANGDGTNQFDRILVGDVTVREESCPVPVDDLRLRRADCDGSTPGLEVLLEWTRRGEDPPFVRSADPSRLSEPHDGWALEPGACLALDPRPLVFYSVADSCEAGSEGPY